MEKVTNVNFAISFISVTSRFRNTAKIDIVRIITKSYPWTKTEFNSDGIMGNRNSKIDNF